MTPTKRRTLPVANTVSLLAGFDTITYSSQARISQEVRAQLAKEKEAAPVAAKESTERRARHDEGYFALLAAHDPVAFDPNREVWRLEFQIRREGLTSFRLAPSTAADEKEEKEDREAQIEAELSAEDVPHMAFWPLATSQSTVWEIS